MGSLLSLLPGAEIYSVGDVAKSTVRAPHSFSVSFGTVEDNNFTSAQIQEGEVLIRRGDVLTELQSEKLLALNSSANYSRSLRSAAGQFMLNLLILSGIYALGKSTWRQFNLSNRDLALVSLILIGSFFLLKLYLSLGEAVNEFYFPLEPQDALIAAPVATGGLLLGATIGVQAVFSLCHGVWTYLRCAPRARVDVYFNSFNGKLCWCGGGSILLAPVGISSLGAYSCHCFFCGCALLFHC